MVRLKFNISKELLEQLYNNEHKSCYTIAQEVGCCSRTIYDRLKEFNIQSRTSVSYRKLNISKEILEQLYIQERKSNREIAKILGCGKSVIPIYLKEFNIPARKNTEMRIGLKFSSEWKKKISINHADVSEKTIQCLEF